MCKGSTVIDGQGGPQGMWGGGRGRECCELSWSPPGEACGCQPKGFGLCLEGHGEPRRVSAGPGLGVD